MDREIFYKSFLSRGGYAEEISNSPIASSSKEVLGWKTKETTECGSQERTSPRESDSPDFSQRSTTNSRCRDTSDVHPRPMTWSDSRNPPCQGTDEGNISPTPHRRKSQSQKRYSFMDCEPYSTSTRFQCPPLVHAWRSKISVSSGPKQDGFQMLGEKYRMVTS